MTTQLSAIPQAIRDGAVQLVEDGQSIVILASRREAEGDVREGLLGVMPDIDLVKAARDVAGRA